MMMIWNKPSEIGTDNCATRLEFKICVFFVGGIRKVTNISLKGVREIADAAGMGKILFESEMILVNLRKSHFIM